MSFYGQRADWKWFLSQSQTALRSVKSNKRQKATTKTSLAPRSKRFLVPEVFLLGFSLRPGWVQRWPWPLTLGINNPAPPISERGRGDILIMVMVRNPGPGQKCFITEMCIVYWWEDQDEILFMTLPSHQTTSHSWPETCFFNCFLRHATYLKWCFLLTLTLSLTLSPYLSSDWSDDTLRPSYWPLMTRTHPTRARPGDILLVCNRHSSLMHSQGTEIFC